MRPSCWRSSNPLWATTRSSRRRSIKHVLEEGSAAPQPVLVDRVADPVASQRFDRDPGAFESGLRSGKRLIRSERIVGAVNQKGARTRAQLVGQEFGGEQPPRKAEDAGNRLAATQPDKEGHHGPLSESDQRQIGVVEPAPGQRI